jgi:protein-S-isoprenylcysteine O-methyltransferase Ste14
LILLLKNLLFTLIVLGTVAVYVPLMLSRHIVASAGLTFVIAMLLFITGGAFYAWCVFDFASSGRATPLPLDAPKKLVRRGLYRYSRNLMYVGVLTLILGWAVLRMGSSLPKHSDFPARPCCGTLLLFRSSYRRRAETAKTVRQRLRTILRRSSAVAVTVVGKELLRPHILVAPRPREDHMGVTSTN